MTAGNSDQAVRLDRAGPIATITLDNPRRANVLDRAAFEQLAGIVDEIGEDESVRAVILTGAGQRAFCGGADVGQMADLNPASARTFIGRLHRSLDKIRRLEKPVVAAVNGACLGAGWNWRSVATW